MEIYTCPQCQKGQLTEGICNVCQNTLGCPRCHRKRLKSEIEKLINCCHVCKTIYDDIKSQVKGTIEKIEIVESPNYPPIYFNSLEEAEAFLAQYKSFYPLSNVTIWTNTYIYILTIHDEYASAHLLEIRRNP